jgi:hypothetical protein
MIIVIARTFDVNKILFRRVRIHRIPVRVGNYRICEFFGSKGDNLGELSAWVDWVREIEGGLGVAEREFRSDGSEKSVWIGWVKEGELWASQAIH